MNDLEKSVNIFKALGDNTRLKIVNVIMKEAKSVNVIAAEIQMTQSAISHQLQILKLNGIIKKERKGKEVYYSLDDDHIRFIVETVSNHASHTINE